MNHGVVACAAIAALAMFTAHASPSFADTPPPSAAIEEARVLYKHGVELYESGAYPAALAELERANLLAPSFRIQYSIGLVHVQMGNFASALAAFDAYLAAGGTQIPKPRRTEVDKRVAELRAKVAMLTIEANVAGTQIAIDDVVLGTTPLAAPIVVNAGRHRIAATIAGYEGETKDVSAAGTERVTVKFELKATPPVEPPPIEPPPPPVPAPTTPAPTMTAPPAPPPPIAREDTTPRGVPWVGWGIAASFGGVAVVTGVVALSASSDLRAKKAERPASAAELDAIASRAKGWALASDLCTGAAVVAAGVSLYLTLKRTPSSSVRVGVSPSAVTLGGAF